MKQLGSVTVKGKEPEITYKGAVTRNLDLDYDEDENAPTKKTYVYFFGIPYAEPPTKEKRFDKPKPYKGKMLNKLLDYDATSHPNYCFQRDVDDEYIGSEDCLYLNIYLPRKPKYIFIPLPVLVYFHSGGLFTGTGNYKFATPDSIIKEDIIFVTVNFRLGPFGFLNMHAEQCKGNTGLKDQVMALRWIKANIAAFRGDPGNVTICGGSTGGSCVNFHLISPLSRGLFHKAIVQSGGIYCPWGFEGHQRAVMRYFKKYQDHEAASRDSVVKDLKSLRARRLVKLATKIKETEFDHSQNMGIHLGPSFESFPEDAFLPKPPSDKIEDLMEQTEPDIPILAGITSKEGYLMDCHPAGNLNANLVRNRDDFIKFLTKNRWTEEAAVTKCDDIMTKYFPNHEKMSDVDIEEGFTDFCTDLWFHRFYDNFKFGKSMRKPAAPLYVYQFDFVSDINPTWTKRNHMDGAGHTDDLVYLFPAKETRKTFHPFAPEVRKTIKTMCSLWASFCKTGKPTCPLYPNVKWLPHTENEGRYLEIGEEIKLVEDSLFRTRWEYFKSIFGPDDQVPSLADTPMSVGATEEDWRLAQSKSAGAEIPKNRKRSDQSKSSSSTPGDTSESYLLSSPENPVPGTSSGHLGVPEYRKPSVLSSSSSTPGYNSDSSLLSSPTKPLPSTSSGISRAFKRFFSSKKKK